MPGLLMRWLQYIPLVFELVKAITPTPPHTAARENQSAIADLKKAFEDQLADIEHENNRLRSRIRDLESLVNTLQLWVWIGGGTLGVLVIILLIAVLSRR